MREADAEKLGDPDARALPLPVAVPAGLREATEEGVADAAEEAERDAPREPLPDDSSLSSMAAASARGMRLLIQCIKSARRRDTSKWRQAW